VSEEVTGHTGIPATQQDADIAELAIAEYADCIIWPVILNPAKRSV